MDTNGKYQNISIQPTKLARTSKTILYELPRENLTEAELVRKSTSDRTKRRVARKAWFPLPVITKPVMTEKPKRKPNNKLVLKKHGSIWSVKPCSKVRQITDTVVSGARHSQSSSSGIKDSSNTCSIKCDNSCRNS